MVQIEVVSADRIGMGDFQESGIQGLLVDSTRKELIYVRLDGTGQAILIKVE